MINQYHIFFQFHPYRIIYALLFLIYKEEDILNYAISKMEFLEIFLKISKEKIRLDAKNVEPHKEKNNSLE